MPTAAKDKNAPALSSRFRKAYEATAVERAALLEAELVTINIDVAKCVTTVLGALPEILALRGAIKKLPQYDLRRFEALERYALATGYAHAMHLAAAAPKDFPDGLLQKVEEERNTLLSDFEALGRRKLMDTSGLQALKGDGSYRANAFELMGLVGLLRQHWSQIAGKTGCQLSDLDRAATVADDLIMAIGLSEQAPQRFREAAVERQRAFTLLLGAYDETRRAVTYLRWHTGDSEEIAPSLYAGRVRDVRRTAATVPRVNSNSERLFQEGSSSDTLQSQRANL